MEVFSQLATADGDEVDDAFARIYVDLEQELIDSNVDEMHDLAAARSRLDNNAFGTCASCGEEIDPARL